MYAAPVRYSGLEAFALLHQYCKESLPHLEKAVVLFSTFKPQTELHPAWGVNIANQLIIDCK